MAVLGTCAYCSAPAERSCRQCSRMACAKHLSHEGLELCQSCAAGTIV